MSHTKATGAQTVPGSIPPLGHVIHFGCRPLKFLASQRELAGITSIRLGVKEARIINDPSLVRELLVSRPKDFIKAGPLYDISSAFVGNGLAISEGPFHRRQRRLIQPAFRRARMPDYHSAMREAAEAMTDRWHDGKILDAWKELFRLSVAVVGNSLAHGRFSDEMTDQIVWSVATASKGIGWRSVTPVAWVRSLPTPEARRFVRAQKTLHSIADQVIAEHRTREMDPDHFLSILLAARDEESGQSLTDQQLRDEVVTLFSAGSGTVATSLAWTLHLLSINPRAEERVHAEALDLLGGRPVTPADLPRLDYLGRVLTEVLRLYPPAWLLPRIAIADTELGGHRIPQGTHVFFSPYSIHHDPRLYSDPERFDPDRWLPERVAERPRSAYLPFGAGVHQCIGNDFAFTESLIALATIIVNWRLRQSPHAKVRPRGRALLEPHGLMLIAERRATRRAPNAPSGQSCHTPHVGLPRPWAGPVADRHGHHRPECRHFRSFPLAVTRLRDVNSDLFRGVPPDE
jgi:cytochrome P450